METMTYKNFQFMRMPQLSFIKIRKSEPISGEQFFTDYALLPESALRGKTCKEIIEFCEENKKCRGFVEAIITNFNSKNENVKLYFYAIGNCHTTWDDTEWRIEYIWKGKSMKRIAGASWQMKSLLVELMNMIGAIENE